MSVYQHEFSEPEKQEIVAYVNNYRKLHGCPDMIWNSTIATFSKSWATYLATNSLFEHSPNKTYGENLAYFQGYESNVMALVKKSIDLWYDEIKLYNFDNPGYSAETGHFTALIWKPSKEMGFGYAYNESTKIVDVAQNIFPPGNISGQYAENVPRLIAPEPAPEPAPAPAPEPAPAPAPAPEPAPAPVPEEEEEEELQETLVKIKELFKNVLLMIRMRYNNRVLLNGLDVIINELYMIADEDFKQKFNMVNKLYYVKYLIHVRRPMYFVYKAIVTLIQELDAIMSQM